MSSMMERIARALEATQEELARANKLTEQHLELTKNLTNQTNLSLHLQRANLQMMVVLNPSTEPHVAPLIRKIDQAMGIVYEDMPLDSGEESPPSPQVQVTTQGPFHLVTEVYDNIDQYIETLKTDEWYTDLNVTISHHSRQGEFTNSEGEKFTFTWTDLKQGLNPQFQVSGPEGPWGIYHFSDAEEMAKSFSATGLTFDDADGNGGTFVIKVGGNPKQMTFVKVAR